MKRSAWILVAFVSFTASTYGIAERGGYSYKVTGNKRTRTSYIHSLLDKCLDENRKLFKNSEAVKGFIRQCLMNSKLFVDMKVSLSFHQIDIEVEERGTFLIVPYAQASSGERRKVGAILLETNFLGMGKIIGLGGTISDAGNNYFVFFRDPKIFLSNWLTEFTSLRATDDVELVEGTERTDGFFEVRKISGLGLGYKWFDWLPMIRVWNYDREFGELGYFSVPDPVNSQHIGAQFTYSNQAFRFYYSQGFSLFASYTTEVERTDAADHLQYWESKASYESLIIWDHALKTQLMYTGTQGGLKADVFRMGSGRGFRGIKERTAWASAFVSASADYHIPIARLGGGTLTSAPFVDLGSIQHRGGENSRRNFATFGVGAYFYLEDVNVPGLGIETGYNNAYQGMFGNFTLGASI